MADLDRAITIAKAAHAEHLDKGKNPYIQHPLRVMLAMGSPEERIVAVLHDVVEDSGWTIEGLRAEGFSENVLSALECLTKRKDEKYKDFIARVRTNDIARAVKIRDLEDNLDLSRISKPRKKDRARAKKYRKAHRTLCPRGSRKHVLDWLGSPGFKDELQAMLRPADVKLGDWWRPGGHFDADEVRLDRIDLAIEGLAPKALESWWLEHPGAANTPNWDLVATAEIEGRPGIVLVEAKAHASELSKSGKRKPGSKKSRANHKRIGAAIDEASQALGVQISRERRYQLSNRIAFAWKLASMGVPVVLLYLGFTGDEGIRNVGKPLASQDQWDKLIRKHLETVGAARLLEARTDCGAAGFWFLTRSREVVEQSPPPFG